MTANITQKVKIILPQEVMDHINEFNADHRPQLNAVFEEIAWRKKYNSVINVIPGRVFCKHCCKTKHVVCVNVDYCTAGCGRMHNEYKEEFGYGDETDDEDYEFSSIDFQYPGWGKPAGRPGRNKQFTLL